MFNRADLVAIVSAHAEAITDNEGEIVRQWREKLAKKFTKLAGIRSLHDFVVVKHIITDEVILRVRELCYTGRFENTKMKLATGAVATDVHVAIPLNTDSYKATKQTHDLPATKLADLRHMYSRFIQRLAGPNMCNELEESSL